MHFLFELVKDEAVSDWHYDTVTNVLQNAEGETVHVTKEQGDHVPGPCGSRPERFHVRVSLGVACNNQCSYCSQNKIKSITTRQVTTHAAFADAVVAYVRKHYPDKKGIDISYWGGEPLMYIDGIRELTRRFQDVAGDDVSFSLCTNGKLLKGETFKWLYDNDFRVAVSHDGPGQFVRDGGRDIFARGSEVLECFKAGMQKERPYAIDPVFHRHNPSMKAYVAYMSDLLETDKFRIGEAAYLRAYDDKSAEYALTNTQLREDALDIIDMLHDWPDAPFVGLEYMTSVRWLRSLNALDRTFCFAQNQTDYMPVDLSGNVWGCHNDVSREKNGDGDALYRGNIFSGEHRVLDFSGFRKRVNAECVDCVMRWLCGGGCLYADAQYRELNCKSSWFHKLPGLAYALYMVSNGGWLRRIIRQPGV